MQFVGFLSLAFGVIAAVMGLFTIRSSGLGLIIQGVFAFIVGLWTTNAAKSFKLITNSQGNDVENLIGALGELRKLYTLQFWLAIIGITFTVVSLIVAVVSNATGP